MTFFVDNTTNNDENTVYVTKQIFASIVDRWLLDGVYPTRFGRYWNGMVHMALFTGTSTVTPWSDVKWCPCIHSILFVLHHSAWEAHFVAQNSGSFDESIWQRFRVWPSTHVHAKDTVCHSVHILPQLPHKEFVRIISKIQICLSTNRLPETMHSRAI